MAIKSSKNPKAEIMICFFDDHSDGLKSWLTDVGDQVCDLLHLRNWSLGFFLYTHLHSFHLQPDMLFNATRPPVSRKGYLMVKP